MSRLGALLRRHLVETCAISARDDSAVDGDYQPTRAYLTVVAGVPCRMAPLTALEGATATLGDEIRYEAALLIPKTAPAPPMGRVQDIRRAADNTLVDAGPWEIAQVIERSSDTPQFRRLLIKRVGG